MTWVALYLAIAATWGMVFTRTVRRLGLQQHPISGYGPMIVAAIFWPIVGPLWCMDEVSAMRKKNDDGKST